MNETMIKRNSRAILAAVGFFVLSLVFEYFIYGSISIEDIITWLIVSIIYGVAFYWLFASDRYIEEYKEKKRKQREEAKI